MAQETYPDPREFTLYSFLERCVLTRQKIGKKAVLGWIRSIEAFGRFLGRSPVVADLSVQTVADAVAGIPPGDHKANEYRWHLTKMLRIANDLEILSKVQAAVSTRDVMERVEQTQRKATQIRGGELHVKLIKYYRDTIKPTVLKDRAAGFCDNFERAVELFVSFVKAENSYVDGLTQHHLDSFVIWGLSHGYSKVTLTNYKRMIRRLLRHARPEDFPRQCGKYVREKQLAHIPLESEGTVWWFFQTHYVPDRLLGRSKVGRVIMENAIRGLCAFAGGGVRVWDLSDDLLNQWAAKMLEEKYAPVTINCRLMRIRCIWRHAITKKLLHNQPTSFRVPQRLAIPDAWTMEEFERLLSAALRPEFSEKLPSGIPAGDFLLALIMTAYDTCLRRGDLFSLRVSDLRLDGVITIMMHKTGQPITRGIRPETMAAIQLTMPSERLLLFPWHGHWTTFTKLFRLLLHAAGLPVTHRNQLQKIRRTGASHAEREKPGSASALLGHLSPEMARKHYIDPKIAATQPTLPPAPRYPKG